MMIGRLRETIEKLEGTETLSAAGAVKESVVFDPKRLAELVNGMADDPPGVPQPARLGRRRLAVATRDDETEALAALPGVHHALAGGRRAGRGARAARLLGRRTAGADEQGGECDRQDAVEHGLR
jgi:hypothetical protein